MPTHDTDTDTDAEDRTVYLYAAFIGDGCLYSAERCDDGDDGPGHARYWYSLRSGEVNCPVCNAGAEPPPPLTCPECDGTCDDGGPCGGCSECRDTGKIARTCPECDGCRVTTGEPFAVERAGPFTDTEADVILSAIGDDGDGYERADTWNRTAGPRGVVVVLEWEPDRAARDW